MPGLRVRSRERGRTRSTGRAAPAPLALLAAALACGPPGDALRPGESGSAASADPPAGGGIRVDEGDGWPLERAWRLESDLVVGEVDGPLAFGRLADVAPRAAGGLWVADALAARVRGFDGSGREVLSVGGRGEGPGELRSPVGVVETGDGRIAVLEAFPPRVAWFDPEGRPAGVTRVGPGIGAAGPGPSVAFAEWAVAPDGTPYADLFGMPLAGGGPEVAHVLLRLPLPGGEGGRADTLLAWRVPAPIPVPGGPIPVLPPRPSWSVAADGSVVWTPGSPYELHRISRTGTPLGIVRRPVEAPRLTPALRDALADAVRRSLAAGAGSGPPGDLLDRLAFPERLPHVAGLWVSRPDGTTYAARYTEESVRQERPTALDVFSEDGRFLGAMPVPPGFAPRAFTPEAVYGVWEDALGVPFAARFRIVRPDP